MSNSFYYKEITDAQWNEIKIVFEKRAKGGRQSLNPRRVFNALIIVIGTAFITSSDNSCSSVCLSTCYNSSMPTKLILANPFVIILLNEEP